MFLPKFEIRLNLVLILATISLTLAEEYRIVTTWDNRTIDHPTEPVILQLQRNDDDSFKVLVDAPFFNNTRPSGQAGDPFYGLWDYEVVEVFFLNDENQYVEIELSPWGQHIVLLLNGYRRTMRHSLMIDFVVNRFNKSWQGEAIIPAGLLPPKVTKMNAYAIHDIDEKRVYEALYPVPSNSASDPDFHNLDAFKPFDRSIILTKDVDSYSSLWTDSFQGIRRLKIANSWNGTELPQNHQVDLELKVRSGIGMIVTVDAPFYDDVVPPSSPSGWPSYPMSSNEVVHLFLFGELGHYLEIEFGPWGHFVVAFWISSAVNVSSFEDQIAYQTDLTQPGRWTGQAIIPLDFLPPVISKCNAHSAHGTVDRDRQINSLYPSAGENLPNFHNTKYAKAIDMSMIYPANDNHNCSVTWLEKTNFNCPNSNAGGRIVNHNIFSIMTLGTTLFSALMYRL